MKKQICTVLILTAFMLTNCSPNGSSNVGGIEGGQDLFRQTVIGGLAGCATCHAIDPGVILIGPSLSGVGERAADNSTGLSVDDYLRQSILDPDAVLVDGFPSGVMPAKYGEQLTDEEVDQLITYLLSIP